MQCPHCEVDLVMSDRQGVEIDYCPKCRGVWLDRGELDKIIERSMQPAQSKDYSQPALSNHQSHHGYPYERKKSWLGELFD